MTGVQFLAVARKGFFFHSIETGCEVPQPPTQRLISTGKVVGT